MIEIRKLTINDWTLVEEKLKSARNFYIAQTKENIGLDNYIAYTAKSFADPEDTTIGYFVNGDLISMTTVYDFKVMPAYLLKNFKHFSQSNLYNPVTNGLAPTLNKIIEIQESRHLYTFYMAKTANPKRLNQERLRKLMFEEGCPRAKNYMITVEEVLPPNTNSRFGLHYKGIYFKRSMQEETAVIRFTLPQEFRTNASQALAQKMIDK
jgi:hypothetical protein